MKAKIYTLLLVAMFYPILNGKSVIDPVSTVTSSLDALGIPITPGDAIEKKADILTVQRYTAEIKELSEKNKAYLEGLNFFNDLPQLVQLAKLIEDGICNLDKVQIANQQLKILGYDNCFMDFEMSVSLMKVENAQTYFDIAMKSIGILKNMTNVAESKFEKLEKSLRSFDEGFRQLNDMQRTYDKALRNVHRKLRERQEYTNQLINDYNFIAGNFGEDRVGEISDLVPQNFSDFGDFVDAVEKGEIKTSK